MFRRKVAFFSTWAVLALSAARICSGETPAPAERRISYTEFIGDVLAANLDLAAQRYNVDLAKADAMAARLWPNPTLSLSGSRDLTFRGKSAPAQDGTLVSQTLPEPRSVGVTQTLDLIGKRRWHVRAADKTYQAAAATFEDFLRNLQLDATKAFTDALAARATLDQQRKAAGYVHDLVETQRVRFERGDLSEADYTQSRLEELQLRNDLREAEAEAAAAQFALNGFLGTDDAATTFVPTGDLQAPNEEYDLVRLITGALATRPDLIALERTAEAAENAVHATKADRFPDVDFGITYTDNPASENVIAPAPHYHQLGINLSVPLPLWNRNQTEIRKAQATAAQARRQLEAAELKAQVQIRTAYSAYRAAIGRVRQFESGGLLRGADDVLSARRYSYEHGQTSLLELLDAQRTDNQIQQNYRAAIADAVKARLELLRAAGRSET